MGGGVQSRSNTCRTLGTGLWNCADPPSCWVRASVGLLLASHGEALGQWQFRSP